MSGSAPETTAQILTNVTSSPFFSTTYDHLKASAANASSYLSPSPMDLLLVVPRMVVRVGSFVFSAVPEQIDNVLGLRNGGSMIAEATTEGTQNIASAASAAYVQGTAAATGAVTEETLDSPLRNMFSFQHVRSFGGVFTYMTSKWALGCFTVVSARENLIRHVAVGTRQLMWMCRQSYSIGHKFMPQLGGTSPWAGL